MQNYPDPSSRSSTEWTYVGGYDIAPRIRSRVQLDHEPERGAHERGLTLEHQAHGLDLEAGPAHG